MTVSSEVQKLLDDLHQDRIKSEELGADVRLSPCPFCRSNATYYHDLSTKCCKNCNICWGTLK